MEKDNDLLEKIKSAESLILPEKEDSRFSVLKKNQEGETVVELKVDNYFDLMCNLKSILALCQNGLYEIGESNTAFCDPWDVLNALGIIEQLLPESEMEILDEVKNQKDIHN